MRRILITIMSALSLAANAQGLDSAFVSMPDNLFPYLTGDQRKELLNVQRIDTSSHAVLTSAFNGKVELRYLDSSRLTLQLDSLSSMEISYLPSSGAGSCCVLRTVATPEMHTDVTVYDKNWNKVLSVQTDTVSLLHRPDTMSVARYEELCKLIEFQLTEAHLEDATTIRLRQNVPMVSAEERKDIEAILVQRRMKWNGKAFVLVD